MKKKIFLLSALCLLEVQWSMAQAPKWVDKAKRAVFSVITYGENDKILNTGNGFFVTEDGVALSDCSLFRRSATGGGREFGRRTDAGSFYYGCE